MELRATGVSEDAHKKAIEAFIAAVGSENVLLGDATEDFGDPYRYRGWNKYRPSAIVLPKTVEEVQEIVRIANEYKVPIWTSSHGRNNGYGGSAPRVNGSVLVKLHRMDQVLEVNEQHGYALVEPGVTFKALYEYLQAKGHRLWVDCPDLEWGSVVGNALDHGVGYTEYGEHANSACGMEVVLANGEIIRTGMGALPGAKSWNLHKRGFGPTADGIFMQSNYGIVTKMGVLLMPEPECWRSCWISTRSHADLGLLVDTLRPLLLDGTIPNTVTIFNLIGLATVISQRSDWYQGEGALPQDIMDKIGEKLNLGQWNARCALYGQDSVVEAKYKILEEVIARVPGATLVSRKYAGSATQDEVAPPDQVLGGHPNLDILRTLDWNGVKTGGHLSFAPIAPISGEDATYLTDLSRNTLAERGLDYAGGLILHRRSMFHVALILFDYTNEKQVSDAYDLCGTLIRKASARGYGEYRAHPEFMDLAEQQYSWGNHSLRRFNETIKDAVDPNGILSPGNHGIWPSSRRHERMINKD